jgi:hypothetical protein
MSRMNVYDAPHKGLRNALSQLQFLSGKTNYSVWNEVERLFDLGREVFRILTIYIETENEIALAELDVRCPGCAKADRAGHDRLQFEQRSIEDFISRIYSDVKMDKKADDLGAEFHLLLSKYHANYLLHIAEEEIATQLLLWKHFTDEELMEHRYRIIERNPPDALLTWVKFITPAQGPIERVRFLICFRQVASDTLFNHAIKLLRLELPEDEFLSLDNELRLVLDR